MSEQIRITPAQMAVLETTVGLFEQPLAHEMPLVDVIQGNLVEADAESAEIINGLSNYCDELGYTRDARTLANLYIKVSQAAA